MKDGTSAGLRRLQNGGSMARRHDVKIHVRSITSKTPPNNNHVVSTTRPDINVDRPAANASSP
jgi:hypothetical protein